jgi:hypothetical protein
MARTACGRAGRRKLLIESAQRVRGCRALAGRAPTHVERCQDERPFRPIAARDRAEIKEGIDVSVVENAWSEAILSKDLKPKIAASKVNGAQVGPGSV